MKKSVLILAVMVNTAFAGWFSKESPYSSFAGAKMGMSIDEYKKLPFAVRCKEKKRSPNSTNPVEYQEFLCEKPAPEVDAMIIGFYKSKALLIQAEFLNSSQARNGIHGKFGKPTVVYDFESFPAGHANISYLCSKTGCLAEGGTAVMCEQPRCKTEVWDDATNKIRAALVSWKSNDAAIYFGVTDMATAQSLQEAANRSTASKLGY